jgi:hypothetical protein
LRQVEKSSASDLNDGVIERPADFRLWPKLTCRTIKRMSDVGSEADVGN